MSRTARQRSRSGIYHVTIRGINKQDIFLDDEDSLFYLNNLRRLRTEVGCTVFGYCLMSNHIHLLVREHEEQRVSKLMHRLGTVFAQWYNEKYQRVGHVFQGRYHSSAVEDDAYLLTVLHYIHYNPIKAQVTDRCGAYHFTSYHAYAGGEDPFGIAEVDLVTRIAGGVKEVIRLFNSPASELVDPRKEREQDIDEHARVALNTLLLGRTPEELLALTRPERNKILVQLKQTSGLTLRQLSSFIGLSPSAIARIR